VAGDALSIHMEAMSKRFGAFAALDGVSLDVPAGTFHALLGENGAGKSTLVKCLVVYHLPDAGEIYVDGRPRAIRSPHDAHACGIGMVYPHFTLVPSMTVAENLVISRLDVPAVLRWKSERERPAAFMESMPFQVPLDLEAGRLAAGQKQKVEILKQLYLRRRFVILDEPTSVLTPAEADEALGLLAGPVRERCLSVLIITHKLREVMRFADAVTVLRRGRPAGSGKVADLTPARMAEMMVGARELPALERRPATRMQAAGRAREVPERLSVREIVVASDAGRIAVDSVTLGVAAGEIVGIAGVSGNGQRELVLALIGQRAPLSGELRVDGAPYRPRRATMRARGVFSLPEEPLRSACVPSMSVAENMALRSFDQPPLARGPWLRPRAMRAQARAWIEEFAVRAQGPDAPIAALSGGNVQRAVLARELSHGASLLIAANPTFGLDLGAVAAIHARILAAREGAPACCS
jgi:simple sugar transport system ATP-binding protein